MEGKRNWLVFCAIGALILSLVQIWATHQEDQQNIRPRIVVSDYTINIRGDDISIQSNQADNQHCAKRLSDFANTYIDRLSSTDFLGENTSRLMIEDLLYKYRVEFSLLELWLNDYIEQYVDLSPTLVEEYNTAFLECDISTIEALVLRDFLQDDPKITFIHSLVRSLEARLYQAKELIPVKADKENNHPLMLAQKGHISFYLKQYSEAAHYYHQAVIHQDFIGNNSENYILMLQNLGFVYMRNNEPSKAIPFFEKALERSLKLEEALPSLVNRNFLSLALAYHATDNSEKALSTINDFEKTGYISAANEPLFFLKSDIYSTQGNYVKAKNVLDLISKKTSEGARKRYKQLALQLRKIEVDVDQKNWGSAITGLKLFDQAKLTELSSTEVSEVLFWKYFLEAYIYTNNSQLDKAENSLRDAFELEGVNTHLINKRVIRARYLYTVILDQKGKHDLAEHQFKLAMNDIEFYYGATSKESISGKRNYGLYLYKLNKINEALLHLRQALVLSTKLLGSTHARTQEIRSDLLQINPQ